MTKTASPKNPGWLPAVIALLLGLALVWLVATAFTEKMPFPARLCSQQSSLCGKLTAIWQPLQRLSAAVTPDRAAAALRQGRRQFLGLPTEPEQTSAPEVVRYFVVIMFVLGVAVAIIGLVLLLKAALLTAYSARHSETRHRSARERALRRWFGLKRPRWRSISIPIAFGGLLVLAAVVVKQSSPQWSTRLCSSAEWLCFGQTLNAVLSVYLPIALLAIGALFVLRGTIRLAPVVIGALRAPRDRKVKAWFEESKEWLRKEALHCVGLHESELAARKPLFILSEILRDDERPPDLDIPEEDIITQYARDGTLYCGAYIATIIFFTHRHIAIYQAEYSFIRGEAMDEDTYESHYEDIVILATSQRSIVKLDTGNKVKWAEQFSLSFPSGQKVPVWVSNKDIFLITGGNRLPVTDAEQAIGVIRSQMRDIKRSAELQA